MRRRRRQQNLAPGFAGCFARGTNPARVTGDRRAIHDPVSTDIFFVASRRRRSLPVQGLAIPHTPSQELRPVRNDRQRIGLFRQQTPQFRVMPAKLLSRAIPVLPDSASEASYLGDELLARHELEIVIHGRGCDSTLIPVQQRGLVSDESLLTDAVHPSELRDCRPVRISEPEPAVAKLRGLLPSGLVHACVPSLCEILIDRNVPLASTIANWQNAVRYHGFNHS